MTTATPPLAESIGRNSGPSPVLRPIDLFTNPSRLAADTGITASHELAWTAK